MRAVEAHGHAPFATSFCEARSNFARHDFLGVAVAQPTSSNGFPWSAAAAPWMWQERRQTASLPRAFSTLFSQPSVSSSGGMNPFGVAVAVGVAVGVGVAAGTQTWVGLQTFPAEQSPSSLHPSAARQVPFTLHVDERHTVEPVPALHGPSPSA